MSGQTPLDPDADPIEQFRLWLQAAEAHEPNDPTAMNVATCTPDGRPSSRMVLLKGVDERGFVFYTNFESRKGQELLANPYAALCFHWKSLRAQVRVEGRASPVSDEEADAYYASRPRDSRIGAWASQQSRPMKGRFELEKRIAETVARFGLGEVPRPPYWSGFRVVPERIEFWRDRPFRLHDRIVYTRIPAEDGTGRDARQGGGWRTERLYP